MPRILIFYFLIYSALHLLMYMRLRALWPRRKRYGLWFAVWAVIMILVPVASYALDAAGWPTAAGMAAWVGFSWMGFACFVLWLSLALWLAQSFLWAFARLARLGPFVWPKRAMALGILLVAACLSIYAYSTAKNIQMERVVINTAKLPAGQEQLKIAMICDLHLSPSMGLERLKFVAAEIDKLKPDILMAVGDVVDRNHGLSQKEARILAGVHAPLGKFAVMGNHEFYVGQDRSQNFLEQAGFIVLRNRAIVLGALLNIAGVDDPGRTGRYPAERPILTPLQNGLFTIFLKHRPGVNKSSLGLFDLQLSGHTHGGQMFPFSLVVRLVHGRFPGLYRLSQRSWLYLSRGTGTWGPPMRFLVPPEITLIELVRTPPGKGSPDARPPK